MHAPGPRRSLRCHLRAACGLPIGLAATTVEADAHLWSTVATSGRNCSPIYAGRVSWHTGYGEPVPDWRVPADRLIANMAQADTARCALMALLAPPHGARDSDGRVHR